MAKDPDKKLKARVGAIYPKVCSGIQIPIMKTVTVMSAGVAAIKADPSITDEALGEVIHAETMKYAA